MGAICMGRGIKGDLMTQPVIIGMFSCFCGFQSETVGDAMTCARCGDPMRQWNTRTAHVYSQSIEAESADKRTENGGY